MQSYLHKEYDSSAVVMWRDKSTYGCRHVTCILLDYFDAATWRQHAKCRLILFCPLCSIAVKQQVIIKYPANRVSSRAIALWDRATWAVWPSISWLQCAQKWHGPPLVDVHINCPYISILKCVGLSTVKKTYTTQTHRYWSLTRRIFSGNKTFDTC